jgi:hypothetical protein
VQCTEFVNFEQNRQPAFDLGTRFSLFSSFLIGFQNLADWLYAAKLEKILLIAIDEILKLPNKMTSITYLLLKYA